MRQFLAAVGDWKIKKTEQKVEKANGKLPAFDLRKQRYFGFCFTIKKNRPKIVMGFAAETENILENANLNLLKRL